MARVIQEVELLEARAAAQRAALALTVAEVSRRVQPRHLVDTAVRMAKTKGTEVLGEVADTVKDHGGKAALLGLGAVAAFEIGRKSAAPPSPPREWSDAAESSGLSFHPQHGVTVPARASAVGRLLAGAALGAAVGGAVKLTDSEKALFAEVGPDVRKTAVAFFEEHSRGAKLVAADTFGLASFAAAFLAIMAATGDWFNAPRCGPRV